MITPAYALTATERVLPRLTLDFTTGTLDPRVSVSRALNTATRVNASGLVEPVNADLPRFDYDPVTLASKGLLIEETRSNVLLQSQTFNDPVWIFSRSSVATDVAVSPDGTMNADKIVEDTTASNTHYATQIFTGTAVAYTYSVFLKAAERTQARLRLFNGTAYLPDAYFDLQAGTATAGGTIVNAGNGWFRCSITATLAASAGCQARILPAVNGSDSYTGDGTSGVYIWGAQLETGAFATSYIPTTTTSLTRNADAVSMTGTNFSDWFNATEGTLQIIGSVGSAAGTCSFGEISDGTSVNAYWFGANNIVGGAPRTFVARVASANQAQLSAKTVVANTVYNSVNAYKVNSFAAAADGNAAVTDTSGTIPTVDRMIIGGAFLGYANGPIQKINYWSQRLTNAEVQAFSK